MEKNSNKGVIALLIVIIIILAVLCVLFATNTISFNSNTTEENEQTIDNNKDKKTKDTKNKNIDNNETNTNNNKENEVSNLKLEGTYDKEAKNDMSYYKSTVKILGETNSSIEFTISTVHGKDPENVNVGNLSGTANKIGENTYQFEEIIEGKLNTILFTFSKDETIQYLKISESYPDSINPYGGHGVYFAGKYEKILN